MFRKIAFNHKKEKRGLKNELVVFIPFYSTLISDELNYFKELVDEDMPDVTKELKRHCFEKSIEYLKEHGINYIKQHNYIYAFRYFIEGVISCVQNNLDPNDFCDYIKCIVDDYLIGDNLILPSLEFVRDVYDISKTSMVPDKVQFVLEKYQKLVKLLGHDDLCDLDDPDYCFKLSYESFEAGKESFEDIFLYWIKKNNYKKFISNIDYFRLSPAMSAGDSVGCKLLRKIFYEELLKIIPDEVIQGGIILLKIAHRIEIFDSTLALNYANKAKSTFHNCRFKEGICWAINFIETENTATCLKRIVNEIKHSKRIEAPPAVECVRNNTRFKGGIVNLTKFFEFWNNLAHEFYIIFHYSRMY